jgi:hypothetical protein
MPELGYRHPPIAGQVRRYPDGTYALTVDGRTYQLGTYPEPGLWTMDSLKIAVLAAVVAAVKKFVANFFVVS